MGPTATALSRDQALSRPHLIIIIIITMDTIIRRARDLSLCLRDLSLCLLGLCLLHLALQKK